MKNRKINLLMVTALICAVSLIVMIFVLVFTFREDGSRSFSPPPFEENAVRGVPDVSEDLGWGEIDTQVFQASVCGVIVPNGNTADVWFTNPESNSVWMKLRISDSEGNIIGETGIIRPGEYVKEIIFTDVPQEGDTIILKLMAYEPETYYSAGSAALTTTVTGGIS